MISGKPFFELARFACFLFLYSPACFQGWCCSSYYLPGGRGTAYVEFLSVTRESWKAIHTWTGIGMLAGVAVHLMIHWKRIRKVSGKALLPVVEPALEKVRVK